MMEVKKKTETIHHLQTTRTKKKIQVLRHQLRFFLFITRQHHSYILIKQFLYMYQRGATGLLQETRSLFLMRFRKPKTANIYRPMITNGHSVTARGRGVRWYHIATFVPGPMLLY